MIDQAEHRPGLAQSRLLGCLIVTLLTLVAFLPVLDNGFVNYDDPNYVTDSPLTQAGLTWEGVRWALTDSSFNWHPLTRLSHMLDCELFGTAPGGHHLTSLLLHVANSVLLFLIFRRMTGAQWPSVAVAVVFGVHPAHVESVAWIAERKDVLSTLFLLLTMAAYARYTVRRSGAWMAATTLALGLGLMAKQMLVTLPFALLLMDVWPLGRLASPRAEGRTWRELVLEKLPLFAIVAAGVSVAVLGQRPHMMSLVRQPLTLRLANALTSYVDYLSMLAWPSRLAVFYALPTSIPWWQVVASATLLLALTGVAWRLYSRAPYLLIGWLWYLGTLVPVIGLVQIGLQSMADRYTYVPSIGLLFAIAWALDDLTARRRSLRVATVAATVVAVAALTIATRAQCRHWRDSVALFQRAAAVAPPSDIIEVNLAEALRERGDIAAALDRYRAAIALNPASARALAGAGTALRAIGRPREALVPLREAARVRPTDARIHTTLAMALDDLGDTSEAIVSLRTAVALDPTLPEAQLGLATLLAGRGAHDEALVHYRAALDRDPKLAVAHLGAARTLSQRDEPELALPHLERALELGLDSPELRREIADLRARVAAAAVP